MDESVANIPTPLEIMKSMKSNYYYYNIAKDKMSNPNVKKMVIDAVNYLKIKYPHIKEIRHLYKDSEFAEKFKGTTMSFFNKRNIINNPSFPHRSQLQAIFMSQPALLMAMLPYWFSDDKTSIYKFLIHKFGQPTKTKSFNYWRDDEICVRWEIAGYCHMKGISLEELINEPITKKGLDTPLNESGINGCVYSLLCKYFPEYKHLLPVKSVPGYFVYMVSGIVIDGATNKKIRKLGVSKYPDTQRLQTLSNNIHDIKLVDVVGPYDTMSLAMQHENLLLNTVNSIAPVGKCNFSSTDFEGFTECWLQDKYAPENIGVIQKISQSISKDVVTSEPAPEEWDIFE